MWLCIETTSLYLEVRRYDGDGCCAGAGDGGDDDGSNNSRISVRAKAFCPVTTRTISVPNFIRPLNYI